MVCLRKEYWEGRRGLSTDAPQVPLGVGLHRVLAIRGLQEGLLDQTRQKANESGVKFKKLRVRNLVIPETSPSGRKKTWQGGIRRDS